MTRTPVYRLSPVLDGLRLRIVGNPGGKGAMRNLLCATVRQPTGDVGWSVEKNYSSLLFVVSEG